MKKPKLIIREVGQKRKYPFSELNAGDYFLALGANQTSLRSLASYYGRGKKKFRCEKTEHGEMRVWRVA